MTSPSPSLLKLPTLTTDPLPGPGPGPSLDPLTSDPIYTLFLSPTFSSTHFSSQSLSSGSAASTAEHLQLGIRLLNSQLRSNIISHHPTLLSHLTSLRHADTSLSHLKSHVESLQSTLSHLRNHISAPRRSLALRSTQLSNLHCVSETINSTIRLLRLCRKLRGLELSADLAKCAELCKEIAVVYEEGGLNGVEVVEEEMHFVETVKDEIKLEAMVVLERGLIGFNQAEVGSGLQVFFNLGELRVTVEGLVGKYKGVGVKSVTVALDVKALRSGMQQQQVGKDGVWVRMSQCMEELHGVIVAVWHLQRVLSKKRDPFTHVLLLDDVIQVRA